MTYITLDNLKEFLSNIISKFGKINGQSIYGEGDLIVGVKPIVEFSSSNITMDPNKYYKTTNTLSSITISLNAPSDTSIANEYLIEFPGSNSMAVSFPSSIKWLNGESPIFESGYTYQISIVNNCAICAAFK